jgi:biotin carboxyl carrier protein
MKIIAGVTVATVVGGALFFATGQWRQWREGSAANAPPANERQDDHDDHGHPDEHEHEHAAEAHVLKLSTQAQKNLGLVSKPLRLTEYWRSIQVPGVIVDRPGLSDRGVTSPAVGVVAEVHAFPGDMVRPGETLFTLRLFSEYLQNAQSELFKATRETELLKEQRARLESGAKSGAIPESRIIELDNQLRRQQAQIEVHRQDLLARGLGPQQLTQIMEGKFVTTIDVIAPPPVAATAETAEPQPAEIKPVSHQDDGMVYYEVQELKVDLGQQVQAGQLLSTLSNHQFLYLEGHAFKNEAPHLERAAQERWPIRVEFAEDDGRHWPALVQTFQIRHLANAIDPATRTFDFFVPLTNQSRAYETDEQTFVVWRFRPGQRVRMHVPVERYQEVIVLPAAAVVREGPEAYVFRQNGDLFQRFPVQVLYEDRMNIVVANDGSVRPGAYVAQSAAASLNRVLKAQAAGGAEPGVHVHADGTVHGAH